MVSCTQWSVLRTDVVYIFLFLQFLKNNVIINKTKVPFPQAKMTLDDLAGIFSPFFLQSPNDFHINWVTNLFDYECARWMLFQKRFMRNIRYLRLYCYQWIDTCTARLIVPKGIIYPVVSVPEWHKPLDIFLFVIYSS